MSEEFIAVVEDLLFKIKSNEVRWSVTGGGRLCFVVETEKIQEDMDKVESLIEKEKGTKERLENENKQLRELVCEFAHYLACPAYVLRPETVKTIIGIAAEERAGR